jgi:hypothetical protein
MLLIGLATVADDARIWSDWHMYQEVRGYLTYALGITPEDVYRANTLRRVAFGILEGALVLAGGTFTFWLVRAVADLESCATRLSCGVSGSGWSRG